jgi:hypothetical protein
MDIREIVEHTLVTPMRAQAAEYRIEQLEKLAEERRIEIHRLDSLCASYRRMNGSLERLLGELHTRFQNKAARDELLLWDEMADMVRDEYLSIHGPSD